MRETPIRETAMNAGRDAVTRWQNQDEVRQAQQSMTDYQSEAVCVAVLLAVRTRLMQQRARIVPDADNHYRAGEAFALTYAIQDITDIFVPLSGVQAALSDDDPSAAPTQEIV